MEQTNVPNWIKTKFSLKKIKKKSRIHGIQMDVFVSPYDVPEAVRGYRTKENNRYAIEFKYLLGDEDKKMVEFSKEITYVVGKASRRLYSIEFDMDSNLIEKTHPFEIKLKWSEMSRAIDKMTTAEKDNVQKQNSDLVKAAVFDNRVELIATL